MRTTDRARLDEIVSATRSERAIDEEDGDFLYSLLEERDAFGDLARERWVELADRSRSAIEHAWLIRANALFFGSQEPSKDD